ncbi:MAG TPA: hypothetical protein VJ836_00675 [Candidatus Saccharimonadales bacterium]|nr:hypothetical protein [Candidatus Saccharimonadales bacterium]
MNIGNLFKSKKQVEDLKAISLLEVNKTVTNNLKLSELRIIFDVSQTSIYQARITYYERPTNWNDRGTSVSERLDANSWPELIDKVIEHFGKSSKSLSKS